MANIYKALVRDVILLNITYCNSMFTDNLNVIKTKHFGIREVYIINNFKMQIRVKHVDLLLTLNYSYSVIQQGKCNQSQ